MSTTIKGFFKNNTVTGRTLSEPVPFTLKFTEGSDESVMTIQEFQPTLDEMGSFIQSPELILKKTGDVYTVTMGLMSGGSVTIKDKKLILQIAGHGGGNIGEYHGDIEC
mmetsp:Transcript_4447/g.4869  ORF Transcript_4447/g.4869 Transcript_4447/m.4869 type:complete len:109 (+) Transcript_4447:192-518(+)